MAADFVEGAGSGGQKGVRVAECASVVCGAAEWARDYRQRALRRLREEARGRKAGRGDYPVADRQSRGSSRDHDARVQRVACVESEIRVVLLRSFGWRGHVTVFAESVRGHNRNRAAKEGGVLRARQPNPGPILRIARRRRTISWHRSWSHARRSLHVSNWQPVRYFSAGGPICDQVTGDLFWAVPGHASLIASWCGVWRGLQSCQAGAQQCCAPTHFVTDHCGGFLLHESANIFRTSKCGCGDGGSVVGVGAGECSCIFSYEECECYGRQCQCHCCCPARCSSRG